MQSWLTIRHDVVLMLEQLAASRLLARLCVVLPPQLRTKNANSFYFHAHRPEDKEAWIHGVRKTVTRMRLPSRLDEVLLMARTLLQEATAVAVGRTRSLIAKVTAEAFSTSSAAALGPSQGPTAMTLAFQQLTSAMGFQAQKPPAALTNAQAGCTLLSALGVIAERYLTSINGKGTPGASVPYCVHVTTATFTVLVDLLSMSMAHLFPAHGVGVPETSAAFSAEAKTQGPAYVQLRRRSDEMACVRVVDGQLCVVLSRRFTVACCRSVLLLLHANAKSAVDLRVDASDLVRRVFAVDDPSYAKTTAASPPASSSQLGMSLFECLRCLLVTIMVASRTCPAPDLQVCVVASGLHAVDGVACLVPADASCGVAVIQNVAASLIVDALTLLAPKAIDQVSFLHEGFQAIIQAPQSAAAQAYLNLFSRLLTRYVCCCVMRAHAPTLTPLFASPP